ncbi:MAG: S41 family peptidase [Bacteroidetes bacterium]|nr:S41 family peptidase [Bacteroidota bacterium]
MRKRFINLSIILLLAGCHRDTPATTISNEAKSYLNVLISLMKQNSINRTTINWDDFTSKVFNVAGAAQSIADTYDAIGYAILHLGDHHSFYVKAQGLGTIYNDSPAGCGGSVQADVASPDSIGYVRVPACNLNSATSQAADFAQALQNSIKSQDRPYLKGWIVDLRGNIGGNMWPMLAGIGPLLDGYVTGYFIDTYGGSTSWAYQNGAALYNGSPVVTASEPYLVINAKNKIAVLMDGLTASSGEAIAIAFKGRSNTLFFGTPSCGLSTANQEYSLSDGAQLFLTSAVDADRNGNKYGGQLAPDQSFENNPSGAVQAAIQWVLH